VQRADEKMRRSAIGLGIIASVNIAVVVFYFSKEEYIRGMYAANLLVLWIPLYIFIEILRKELNRAVERNDTKVDATKEDVFN
jgi:hypothetical protein